MCMNEWTVESNLITLKLFHGRPKMLILSVLQMRLCHSNKVYAE